MIRFIQANGKILQTVKLTFQYELQKNKTISEGNLNNSFHYQPHNFVQSGIRIIRCCNCQEFENFSGNCNSTTASKHCSEEHKNENCANKELEKKCMNCKWTHDAGSLDCPIYFEQKQVVYVARGLTVENLNGCHDTF